MFVTIVVDLPKEKVNFKSIGSALLQKPISIKFESGIIYFREAMEILGSDLESRNAKLEAGVRFYRS